MSEPLAALPMYDWPECRDETDALWQGIRDGLRARGVAAPDALTRGGDVQAIWRDPDLLLAQTCWGPLEAGLANDVQVLAQPDYSAFEGGVGPLYSSAIVMRRDAAGGAMSMRSPEDGMARLPLDRMGGMRFAFNDLVSRSGYLGLIQDLREAGEGIDLFSQCLETGGHRQSLRAVRDGRADLCAVDCRSWALAQRFEPGMDLLLVAGWTARRPGLPYITSLATDAQTRAALRAVLAEASCKVNDGGDRLAP